MKLASFEHKGKLSYGAIVDDGVVDLGRRLGSRFADLKSAIRAGGLGELVTAARSTSADYKLGEITLLPVIPNPDKILCVGLNYESHREETGRPKAKYPAIFVRFANTQVGHGGAVWRPRNSVEVDYEGELAVIIGRRARHVTESRALEYIAGYSCYNDVSIRDWQNHTHQWTPGKNFPHSGAFGPWMVTADEIADPTTLELTTRLNGQVMQNATTDLMIFSVRALIAYCSDFTALEPGDVISTGTPGGVGFRRNPPVFMKAGDVVEVEISKIGTLRNRVEEEPAEG
jgi:2-keto-4-pentenoate hydratase/2-oxohepta-3-ene-1,7-dioic acid hydratase in catechol pathway